MAEKFSFKNLDIAKLKTQISSTKFIISATSIIVLGGIILTLIQSCAPRQGSFLYGVCGTFLEKQIAFPHTLQHTSVEQYKQALRIYFTHIDSFGQYQFEMIECTFRQDPEKGFLLNQVFFNYVKSITEKERIPGKGRLYAVRQEVIDLFNQSNSAKTIMSQNPDLSLPQMRPFRF